MPIKFTKMQGAGNDFVLVEAPGQERDWPELTKAVCHRHFGIGADGLLIVLPSRKADFRMRVFNPDGSEAEACGNGLRCFARYIIESGLCGKESGELSIETMAGVRKARLIKGSGGTSKLQVGMGEPHFKTDEIPVNIGPVEYKKHYITLAGAHPLISGYPLAIDGRELKLSFVSMGNPHAIFFQEQPVSDFPLCEIGKKIENDIIFPRKTNFEVARVTGRSSIDVRVWERGTGETLACGSGACAVAVAGSLAGCVSPPVSVNLPGGTLEIDWDGLGEVFLSGPAEKVFTGEWPEKD